ncbi:glutathione S-transferase family protein [Cereibacter sediminicola]|uniref:glutathione S-transferase family protein n=1 Tax=Cereibacter sediminicola TaxID=2584941 RepID=UPI0011A330AF|nr:glutathione S-transferase family protein [Cereibacter sediminicola]
MTDLTLRHVPFSRSTRILWLLEEIGCPYRLDLLTPATTLDAALHPAEPPALRDGEVAMHETGAMTEWLCETRAPQLWRAPGTSGRIGWLDWVHYAETLAQHVARRAEPPAADRLINALDLLNAWLQESEWLLSGFSGADCQVGYSVWIASRVIPLEGHPALHAYLGRCEARPAFRAAFGATDVRLS